MCPLCDSPEREPLSGDGKRYWHCRVCDLRYLDPQARLVPAEEKERYHLHEPGDDGYRRFVNPLLERVRELVPCGSRGLDFGAGRYPVMSGWLREMGYDVAVYDPYFWPVQPEDVFDFVVTCEVVEHLYNPGAEFRALRERLKPGGVLVIMTDLVRPETDFANWYYRRDPTHVVFYSSATFEWITRNLGFEPPRIEGRVVSLKRSENG